MQVPQPALRALPQLSVPDFDPHWAPTRAQNTGSVSGVQQCLVPSQTLGPAQVPQLIILLQPSGSDPQFSVPQAVPIDFGWQTHWLLMQASWAPWHVGQVTMPLPQPLTTD